MQRFALLFNPGQQKDHQAIPKVLHVFFCSPFTLYWATSSNYFSAHWGVSPQSGLKTFLCPTDFQKDKEHLKAKDHPVQEVTLAQWDKHGLPNNVIQPFSLFFHKYLLLSGTWKKLSESLTFKIFNLNLKEIVPQLSLKPAAQLLKKQEERRNSDLFYPQLLFEANFWRIQKTSHA